MSPELLRLTLCAEEILYYYVPAYVYDVAEQLLKKPQHHDLVLAIVTPIVATYPWEEPRSRLPSEIQEELAGWLHAAPLYGLVASPDLYDRMYVNMKDHLPDFLQCWPPEQHDEALLELLRRLSKAYCD